MAHGWQAPDELMLTHECIGMGTKKHTRFYGFKDGVNTETRVKRMSSSGLEGLNNWLNQRSFQVGHDRQASPETTATSRVDSRSQDFT